MGFLSGFLRNRRRQKLIEELENNERPSPGVFVELVQMLREEGDYQSAVRVAKRGGELYPDSESMVQTRSDMERITRELEKERLRQKIENYPNPILYARLAELYKADGQTEAAMRVCQAGISSFPQYQYGGTYLVLGEICFDSSDYAGARVHLEKAAELDKYNYTALKLLAEVYMKLSLPGLASRRLEEILYFAPGDEAVIDALALALAPQDLPRAVGEGEGGEAPEAVLLEPAPGAGEPEAALVGSEAVEAAPPAVKGEQELNEAIRTITAVSGTTGAILTDPWGLVIAADLGKELDEQLAGAMITTIFRSVSRSAEAVGIGTFEDGLIEGEKGNIHLMGVEDMILAVFAEPTARMGMLEKSIRDFCDRIL